jgi:hypothetical protein
LLTLMAGIGIDSRQFAALRTEAAGLHASAITLHAAAPPQHRKYRYWDILHWLYFMIWFSHFHRLLIGGIPWRFHFGTDDFVELPATSAAT